MCARACDLHIHVCAKLRVCTLHVRCVRETEQLLIDETTFVLTSLWSGFTLRKIWLLTLQCFYCCLEISEAYTISLLLAFVCVCVLVLCVYLSVFCLCIFLFV